MTPLVLRTVAKLRRAIHAARHAGQTVGLVPTMGALHQGHGALIDRARADSGCVVVSIFVNPLQFDRQDDYERYARTFDADIEFCGARGVDLVFAPDTAEMYPHPQRVYVDTPKLGDVLCGISRPGHFRGVATVVAKLFHIVQPDRAYFGEKDAQQLAIIQALAADLNMPIDIVPVATVREADGLAISSRNVRLTPEQRRSATALYRALRAVADRLAAGESPAQAKQAGSAVIRAEPGIRLEYLEIVDPQSQQSVDEIRGPARIAIAAWAGDVRLIDNVLQGAGQ